MAWTSALNALRTHYRDDVAPILEGEWATTTLWDGINARSQDLDTTRRFVRPRFLPNQTSTLGFGVGAPDRTPGLWILRILVPMKTGPVGLEMADAARPLYRYRSLDNDRLLIGLNPPSIRDVGPEAQHYRHDLLVPWTYCDTAA